MLVVPPKGLILVTGANGYIGSVAVKVFLDQGYSVRGTVRSAAKYQWMLEYFGPNFSLTEVPDLAAPGALVDAIKGVDGVAHIAVDLSYNPSNIVIDEMVNTAIGILEACAKEPSVKRVCFTSSMNAHHCPMPGVPYKINKDTWNEAVVELVEQPWDDQNPLVRGHQVYCAAKTISEQKAFGWVKEHKPSFIFNTVGPNVNIGQVPALEHLGFRSSGMFIEAIDRGFSFPTVFAPAQWMTNVEDTVLLHLATLTLDEVQNERVLAMAWKFSWTEILEVIHRRYPERKSVLASADEPATDQGELDNSRAVELLQKMGRDGFKSLEDTVVECMEVVIAARAMPVQPMSQSDAIVAMLSA